MRTNFSPSAILGVTDIESYIEFIKYSLEYQTIILEQLAEQKERELLRKAVDIGEEPYGIILQGVTIRDLGGITLDHIGTRGQSISKAVIAISQDNYPELLGKMVMINTPWIFNGFWWVLKNFLPTRTLEKIVILGGNYQTELFKIVDPAHLPAFLGGSYQGNPFEPLPFDSSVGGLLHCPDEMKAPDHTITITNTDDGA
ncbi:SFH2 [Symbiodinium microadriaticum]|nr:SFH2 [Symbiodinium microadriaticum]